jgi:hypothetical protein
VLRFALGAAFVTFAGWFVIERWAELGRATEQRALDARGFELMMRTAVPGSALACLDALAGEVIELACEKALFASPEAVAAAVSYVAAQLTLLSAAHEQAGRAGGSYGAALTQMRRAAESDRFGIVAQVLVMRDGCTAGQCGAFVLFKDPSRISSNINEQIFDGYVKRHATAWSGDSTRPVVSNSSPPTSAPAPVAGVRTPNNLFFPSASSIPPVSIMNAEPGSPQDTTGSAEAGKPARKPSQQPLPQVRPAANASPAPSAPLPLAPAPQ